MPSEKKPRLNLVSSDKQSKSTDIETSVRLLETCGGSLDIFLSGYVNKPHQFVLFDIYKELSKPENAELKVRWQEALYLCFKVKMDMLTMKAFNVLENYEKPVDISFGKTVLMPILLESSEQIKSKYRLAVPTSDTEEPDELAELEKEFDDVQ